MAGYIITVRIHKEDSETARQKLAKYGIYSTIISSADNSYWNVVVEGTIADYLSIKAGNHMYSFINRKVYGVDELVDLQNGDVSDSKFLSFLNDDIPGKIEEKE